MPFNIQGPELILILIIALIVIGPGKLPDVGAALGKSIREFRKAAADVKEVTNEVTAAAQPPATASTAAPQGPVATPATPPAPVTPVEGSGEGSAAPGSTGS